MIVGLLFTGQPLKVTFRSAFYFAPRSKGADLMAVAVNGRGENALKIYGDGGDLSRIPRRSTKPLCSTATERAPHPSQVQRRKDENWARRLPFVLVTTGCDFKPLLARQPALLLLNPPLPPPPPPDVKIPPLEIARPWLRSARS